MARQEIAKLKFETTLVVTSRTTATGLRLVCRLAISLNNVYLARLSSVSRSGKREPGTSGMRRRHRRNVARRLGLPGSIETRKRAITRGVIWMHEVVGSPTFLEFVELPAEIIQTCRLPNFRVAFRRRKYAQPWNAIDDQAQIPFRDIRISRPHSGASDLHMSVGKAVPAITRPLRSPEALRHRSKPAISVIERRTLRWLLTVSRLASLDRVQPRVFSFAPHILGVEYEPIQIPSSLFQSTPVNPEWA